jgi:hypothetical protein
MMMVVVVVGSPLVGQGEGAVADGLPAYLLTMDPPNSEGDVEVTALRVANHNLALRLLQRQQVHGVCHRRPLPSLQRPS